jgi:AcrR family transcriptional regulator
VSTAATRPYHHGNLRAALLAQAEEVIRREGVGALSLRDLARAVGVSHAAPRRHFADKQALLDALAVEGFDRLGHELDAALAGRSGAPFAARVQAMVRAYVAFAAGRPALLDVMFAAKHREPDEALREASGRAFAAVRSLIAEGQESGELAPGDPEAFATALFAVLQGLLALVNGGMLPPDRVDATVTDTVDRLLRGSRPPAG